MARAETGQSLWRFAHPNAKSLIGLDVGRIRRSGLGRSFERSWLKGIAGHFPGLELLDQVEQLLVSSPGSANADDPSEPPVLLMVRGHFDPTKVRQLFREHGAKSQLFDGTSVFRPPGKAAREFAFAVLDAETILAGDAQSIFSCIERMRLPASESLSGLAARAENFKSDYDFWVLMTEPSVLASQRLPIGALAQSGLLRGLSGLELGMSMREGLSVAGSLMMGGDSDARAVKEEFSKLLKLVAKDHAGKPEWAQLAKKLKLEVEGAGVKFSLRMAKPELEASLRKLQAQHKTTESILVESAPAAPAKPQVIRIEGLDEGAREVKYAPQPH